MRETAAKTRGRAYHIVFTAGIIGLTVFITEIMGLVLHFGQQSLVLLYAMAILIISSRTPSYI